MKKTITLSSILAFAAVGCGKKDSDEGSVDVTSRRNVGCVQGVVVNGLTGDRIKLPGTSETLGINVLVQNQLLPAAPAGEISQKDKDSVALNGEYTLCGVPLDETYPLIANVPGFSRFYSYVHIDSTIVPKAPQAKADLVKITPTYVANIRLYPDNAVAQDVEFHILDKGVNQAEVTVKLEPLGTNILNTTAVTTTGNPDASRGSDFFLRPFSGRYVATSEKTNAEGKAKFAGSKLVLGGEYQVTLFGKDGSVNAITEKVVPGLTNGANLNLQSEPFKIVYQMTKTRVEAKVISTTETNQPNSSGAFNIVFNRDIEISILVADTPANFVSIQRVSAPTIAAVPVVKEVTRTVTGNILTLRTNFAAGTPSRNGFQAVYNTANILVRIKGEPTTKARSLRDLLQNASIQLID